MKKIIILMILFSLSAGMWAQNNYFGINLGTSIPKNELSESGNIFTNGYALSGFSIQFDGVYFPVSIVGAGAMLGFGSLYMDNNSYLDGFVSYLDQNPDYSSVNIPLAGDFSVTPGFWNYFNIFVGPEIAVPIGRIQLGIRAMGGLSTVIYPQLEVSFENNVDRIYSTTRGAHPGIGYTYGGGIMYKLNSGSALKLSADYFTASARHKFDLEIESIAGDFTDSRRDDMPVEALHVSLGLFYMF